MSQADFQKFPTIFFLTGQIEIKNQPKGFVIMRLEIGRGTNDLKILKWCYLLHCITQSIQIHSIVEFLQQILNKILVFFYSVRKSRMYPSIYTSTHGTPVHKCQA